MGIAHPEPKPPKGAKSPKRVIPFGKYLLLERIAVGGMAELFIAKSFGVEGFEKILAIKRILPTMAEDNEFIEMFIDEAKIAGQLNHANIVPIYELGKISDSHYIAMEYVRGKDMLQIMNRFRRLKKRMPTETVAFIGSKICEGLDYAHKKRDRHGHPLHLIHRDVSPQNILVDYEGQVRIIDFGIAKATSRTTKTQAGVLKGKFGYMSPEQVRGLPIDHRSDLFALGTGLYEMLTSERLFLGESDFTTLERVRNADVPPLSSILPDIPKELENVVMRALAREPNDRWQSAAEMQTALLAFLARKGPPFTAATLSRWMKGAFEKEMREEKARLDYYAHIGRPSVLGTTGAMRYEPEPAPPNPRGGDTDLLPADPLESGLLADIDPDLEPLAGDATVISPSPFASGDMGSVEFGDETTKIFFANEEFAKQSSASIRLPETRISSPEELEADVPWRTSTRNSAPSVLSDSVIVPERQPSRVRAHPPLDAGGDTQLLPDPSLFPSGPQHPVEPPPDDPAVSFGTEDPPTIPEQRRDESLRWIDPSPNRTRRLGLLLGTTSVLLLLSTATILYFLVGIKPGVIRIHTVPEVEATVKLDDLLQGSAPLTIENVEPGEHTLEISASGYQTVSRVVQVTESSQIVLEVALTPVPSIPVEAAAPPATEPSPESEAEPRTPADSESSSPETQETTEAVNTPAPAETTVEDFGTLAINTVPSEARIFIDGEDTGRITPVTDLRISAGRHEVGLQPSRGPMLIVEVEIEPGETEHIARRLRR